MSHVPIETIDVYGDSVWLHNLALIETEHVDMVAVLLRELVKAAGCHTSANLRHVLVLPASDRAETIEHHLRRLIAGQAAYQAGEPLPTIDHEPLGSIARTVSVPVEHEGRLTTFLLASELSVRTITQDNVYSLDNVSHMLEALLHASMHGHIRDICRGDGVDAAPSHTLLEVLDAGEIPGIHDAPRPPIRRGSVRDLAANILESYLVYRYKIAIMKVNPLIYVGAEDEFKAQVPRRCADLAIRLEQGADDLRSIVCAGSGHNVDHVQQWDRARRCLLRGILDPIACHAAYASHNPNDRSLTDIDRSYFYQSKLATFWPRVCKELEIAYAHDNELEASLDTLVVLVSMLLAQLGIVVKVDPEGHQHVDFDRRWAGVG